MFSRNQGFVTALVILTVFLFAAAAPSPLYTVYQQAWGFSAITLTVVFALYAAAMLVALVTVGGLSDFIGRKPAVIASLVIEAAAMAVFLAAGNVAALFLARILQGFATGLGMSALSAMLIDLAPLSRPRLGPLLSSVIPTAGLAAGAVGSGALVQWGPSPTHLVFIVMLAAFGIVTMLAFFLPEPVTRKQGALGSLAPSIAVPSPARRAFLAASPAIAATWATGGLYLSLSSSLLAHLLGVTSHFESGLTITALFGMGAAASFATKDTRPVRAMQVGAGVLAVGTLFTLVSLSTDSVALFFVGSLVAGFGFGASFSGAFRMLAPMAAPHERAELFSAIYVVSYVAFSVPAVIAGIAATHIGLHSTADAYGAVVIAFAAITALGGARLAAPAVVPAKVIADLR